MQNKLNMLVLLLYRPIVSGFFPAYWQKKWPPKGCPLPTATLTVTVNLCQIEAQGIEHAILDLVLTKWKHRPELGFLEHTENQTTSPSWASLPSIPDLMYNKLRDFHSSWLSNILLDFDNISNLLLISSSIALLPQLRFSSDLLVQGRKSFSFMLYRENLNRPNDLVYTGKLYGLYRRPDSIIESGVVCIA